MAVTEKKKAQLGPRGKLFGHCKGVVNGRNLGQATIAVHV